VKSALIGLALVLGLAAPAAAQAPASGADGGRLYGRAEYLLWWTKDSPNPVPLVTDTEVDRGARVFLGGDDVDLGHRNGMRFTLGYWLTSDRGWGVEGSGFYLPKVESRASVSSSGLPGSQDLLIPFFDPTLPGESGSPLSSVTDKFSGTATETLTSKLWGAEGSVLRGLTSQGPWRVELLGGFRYLKLAERLSFATSSPDIPPGPTTVFQTQDVFDADNDFYGGQLGVRGRYRSGRWTADATLKVAVGAMHQSVDVSGALATNFFSPPTVQSFPSGIFAQATNSGSRSRDVVAVVPELGLNVGFRLTDWASIVVGYTFLYASNVARPGNQIDRTINPTQSPSISLNNPAPLAGTARPASRLEGSDFWAHGLNVGLGISF
jgi:hypothetical protein